MKILHVISTLQMGGAEHLMVDLLPALRDLGNEVELLLINGERTPFYDELERQRIKIHKIQERGRIYSPLHIFKARKYLHQYDVIHTHTSPCQFLMAAAKKLSRSKVHLVTTEHSTNNHRRAKKWFKPVDKWMYRQYDVKICISEKARTNLVTHIEEEKSVVTIHNGIDCGRFASPIKEALPVVKNITMIASMRDAKDQDTLIKAVHLLGKGYMLKLVGDGSRRTVLENLANELNCGDCIEFCGNRDDIPQLLKQSDIVVHSSHWEGFGLAAVEAMAAGRPLIASDIEGLHEVVHGAGILFPPGDYAALANIIRDLCNNPKFYNLVAARCQDRSKQFDISLMAEKYNQVYQSLLK